MIIPYSGSLSAAEEDGKETAVACWINTDDCMVYAGGDAHSLYIPLPGAGPMVMARECSETEHECPLRIHALEVTFEPALAFLVTNGHHAMAATMMETITLPRARFVRDGAIEVLEAAR